MSRLPTGGLIDRARPIRFTFDGRPFVGGGGRHARLRPDRQRR